MSSWGVFRDAILGVIVTALVLLLLGRLGTWDYEDRCAALAPRVTEEAACATSR